MGKKKNTRSVVITIIITLIVLGCLTFAAMQFLIPAYVNAHEGEGNVQYKIYVIAVKLFPLLVGIVLIVIAAMIANSRDDEEDEEDMLPPNSYDSQLFEKPSDDPTSAAPAAAAVPETVEPVAEEEKKEEDFFDIFADKEEKPEEKKDDFMSIFGEDEPEKEEEQKEEEPAAEDVFSDVQPEPEAAPEPEPEPEKEPEPESEPAPAPVVAAPSAGDSALIAAIYALIKKLDNITDLVVVEDEEFEEPEEIPEDVPEEPEDTDEEDDRAEYEKCPVEPAPEEEEKKEAPATVVIQDDGSVLRIERKIDKLCDIVANLATIIATQAMSNIQAPAAPAPEAPAEPEAPAAPAEEPVVEEPVETVREEDRQLNDIDFNDPEQLAKVEFDSSRECEYDITCAFTKASVAEVHAALPETAYAFEIKGRTVVIIPFLDKDEAVAELDKIGAEYESVFTGSTDAATFDEVVTAKL